jgi:hypothetical protein
VFALGILSIVLSILIRLGRLLMARKSKSVAKHKIPEIAASLKAKAAIPMTLAIEDTISQLAAPIQAMLDAGYSYTDVAAVFKEHGVDLAATRIQSYHRKQLKSDAQVTPVQQSLAGETSPAVAVEERTEKTQISVPSSEDNRSEQDSDRAKSEVSGDESENALVDTDASEITPVGAELSPSSPTPNPQTAKSSSSSPTPNPKKAKSSSSPPTQAKSQFNVTDRSKL